MKKLIFILSCLLFAAQLVGKNPVEDLVNNKLLENANISLLVTDVKTNQILYQFRPRNSDVPASTMKLVTTATALEILGPDFCFETKLEIDGTVSSDSVLNGNLYIHGGGDPTLGSQYLGNASFLNIWVEAVKRFGIKKITGSIIADASLFDDEGVNPKWTWEDLGNYYAAGTYGISYLDNTYQLVLRSGRVGTTPEILRTIPEIKGLTLDNKLHSTNISFDSAYFYGAPHSNYRSIVGEVPVNRSEFIIKGDIPNPGALLAQHFYDKLIENGFVIIQLQKDKVVETSNRRVIYTYDSPPLSEIITETNVHSNNLYAEHLFRYLALQRNTVASISEAVKVVDFFWKLKGLPVDQLFMCDGSGLSPSDGVSAQFFVDLLTYMNASDNRTIFINSLPIAGESGTLSSFLKNTHLQGKVHAKSGTISRVKCYAGYIENKSETYAFALMVNNANGSSKAVTKKMEEFLLQLFENNK